MLNSSPSMVITVLAVASARARENALSSKNLSLLQHNAHLQKSGNKQEAVRAGAWAETTLSTMHGCECAENWHYDGLELHGCVFTEAHDFPWCFVKDAAACKGGYKKAALLSGGDKFATGTCSNATGCDDVNQERSGTWDFCALPEEVDTYFTQNGCHCLPTWEHKRILYSGCAQPDGENSSAWCHVAESNCSGAKAADATKKQGWDHCDLPGTSPAYVTRHSCHCKPTWEHDGKSQSSCVASKLLTPPEVLEVVNATDEAMYGWCHVFEDERECPGAVEHGGHPIDLCFLVDEPDVTELETTLHGCHCLPQWALDDILYTGCSQTHGAEEEARWCRVIEDESVCPHSLGPEEARPGGAGRGIGRWDWCGSTSKVQDWRLSDERFTPKEPDPPDWYQDFSIDHDAGKNDIEE